MNHRKPTLSLSTLSQASRARLPQFRNGHGGPAHASPDGSDWSPATWLQALMGELGEFARVRHEYECGRLSYEDYKREAAKELADVQCYLAILSLRALDRTAPAPAGLDPAQQLQLIFAQLGEYANCRKKFERGDIPFAQVQLACSTNLADAMTQLAELSLAAADTPKADVIEAHPSGVDLGHATTDKFNEVSVRVGSPLRIVDDVLQGLG